MSVLDDVRTTIDPTPLFVVVGATDLAVEKVREARVRAQDPRSAWARTRADLTPAKVQARAAEFAAQVQELPARAVDQGKAVSDRVAVEYADLATRGKGLVRRIRTQRSTQDLLAQAESTVAQAKGAVTTARQAVADVERSAKATVTTGRKEAARVASTIVDSVADEAKTAQTEVTASVKRTRSAAKRTGTTGTKAAKKTGASATSVRTSASKTAKAGPKAAKKAAAKVGD
ncbi:MAG: hypothetical protein ACRCXL_01290 [Dermatophilaceae bacterium]